MCTCINVCHGKLLVIQLICYRCSYKFTTVIEYQLQVLTNILVIRRISPAVIRLRLFLHIVRQGCPVHFRAHYFYTSVLDKGVCEVKYLTTFYIYSLTFFILLERSGNGAINLNKSTKFMFYSNFLHNTRYVVVRYHTSCEKQRQQLEVD